MMNVNTKLKFTRGFLTGYSTTIKKTYHQLKKFRDYFWQNHIPWIKKKIIVVVANAEMYPWIPMELFADPMGSVGYTLGTASIEEFQYFMAKVWYFDGSQL